MRHWLCSKEWKYITNLCQWHHLIVIMIITAWCLILYLHMLKVRHYNSLRSTRGFTDASYTTHLIIPATVIASRPAKFKLYSNELIACTE